MINQVNYAILMNQQGVMAGFSKTHVDTTYNGVSSAVMALENEWITSVLKSLGVPEIMTDKAANDPDMTSQMWRNYLFDNFGIEILRIMKPKSVQIHKINFTNAVKAMVAEWKEPRVARIKEDNNKRRLILDYWSAV